MADGSVVQISRLVDERGLSSFHVKLIIWSLFIVFIDGYDIGAIGFAAPELVKAWAITNRGALGPVLGASLIGILFGSGLFGYIGDRYGRKVALIGSMLVFGSLTWGAAYATNLNQMFWLRLLAGIGIGGVIPNVIALNMESAPRHLRATLALIAVGLVPLGGAIPGIVSIFLVPTQGWQILFLVGGITPIVISAVALFGLPESIKFMALHESHRKGVEKLLAAIKPGIKIPAGARFVIEDEKNYKGFSPTYLFRDGLHWITPLLWLLFALNLMGFFFLSSWTPTLLEAAHSPTLAKLATIMIQVGGTIGALTLCRVIDKYRFVPIAILFVIAVPVVGSIGFWGVSSETLLLVATFFTGFCVLGIQSGINVAGAMIYPTSLRSNGSGWELGIGRIGSIIGPVLGGLFIAMPVQQLYMWAAVPFAVGAVICFTVYRLNEARLKQQPLLREGQTAPAE